MNDNNIEISQEIFRRMNESGQTNYLHSLFLYLSAEKIVQNMDKLGCNNNFSLLFPRKTEPHFDQEELKRCHIANNIVFNFLKKHNMKISINTALLEFSSKYISNKEDKELKAELNCPKSESLIQSLVKFHINNLTNSFNSNDNTNTKYDSGFYSSNNYTSNNENNEKVTMKIIKMNNNNNNGMNKSSNMNTANSTITTSTKRKISCSNRINTNTFDSTNNNNDIDSKNRNSNLNIYINNYAKDNNNGANNKQTHKTKKKKKVEKLERGVKSPKNNPVTIKWDMSKSGSGNASYTYNSYNYNTYNTYENSDSPNGQYYDSICYDSEEALRNETKMLNISKGAVRKVDLLHPIFNFKHSKLEELLEIKRRSLSSKMFNFQITVTIIEAKDLSIIDFLSSLDPFCKIQIEKDKVFKTKVIENSKSPVWNCYFQCEFESLDTDTYLNAEIYDSDPLGTDKKLSSVQIYLFEVMDDLTIDRWFEMGSDTIFKLKPQLHLKISVDLKEKDKHNDQIELDSQNSYGYDLNSVGEDNQPNDNKLWF